MAAVVAAIVSLRVNQRKISIENITQDRRAWREKIRAKALELHDALLSREEVGILKLQAEFRALLNPNDHEDNQLVNCIELPEAGSELVQAEEFSSRIALLLKHDWDRAKGEARPFPMRVNFLRPFLLLVMYEPKRQKYEANS